jgi:hypothetical protein
MVKRFAWFAAGAAAGVSSSVYAQRKVKAAAKALAPSNIASNVATAVVTKPVQAAKDRGRAVVGAVRDGRDHMAAREAELKAVRDGHAVVSGPRPVIASGELDGQVIDLRQAQARAGAGRVRRRRSEASPG